MLTIKAEFNVTLNYAKRDIVLGTESWLKGIKPGKNATKDAVTFWTACFYRAERCC
jgi:hypothetical protein